jgi:drug/metabolite transporter (DMT)-like permease
MAAQAGMLPLSITAARGALTALVIALWLFVTKSKFSTDRVTLRHMLVLGFLNGLFPHALIAIAMLKIESAPAAMILAIVPILVAVFGNFILPQDRLELRQWFDILVGSIGVLIVIDPRAVI